MIIVCISTDIGGYIFGKIFKGPRLTKVSPKKTYTGVIGSFLISLLFGLIYIKYLGQKSRILLESDLIFNNFNYFIYLINKSSRGSNHFLFQKKSKIKRYGKNFTRPWRFFR